jgi:hypothetical protein
VLAEAAVVAEAGVVAEAELVEAELVAAQGEGWEGRRAGR